MNIYTVMCSKTMNMCMYMFMLYINMRYILYMSMYMTSCNKNMYMPTHMFTLYTCPLLRSRSD